MGSSNSMASLQQTPMNRTNSVTSMLKRLFSKEEQRQPATASVTATQTDSGESLQTFVNQGTIYSYFIVLRHAREHEVKW